MIVDKIVQVGVEVEALDKTKVEVGKFLTDSTALLINHESIPFQNSIEISTGKTLKLGWI